MNASNETTVATTSGKRESVPPDDPRSGPGTTFREMRALAERRAREDELALSPGERDFEQLTHELSVHQIELQLQNEQLRAIQRELEESRDRYRDLFENAPLGYVALRFDGIVERANQKACTLLGWQEAQLAGRRLVEFIAHEDRPRYQVRLRELLRDGAAPPLEVRLHERGQPGAWTALTISLVRGENPSIRVALVDISERIAMLEHISRLAAIVSSSEDAIVSRDREGRVTSWNAGATALFGYASEEMIGRPLDRLVPPERRDEEAELVQRLRRGERIAHFESERLSRDGTRLALSLSLSPVRDEFGRVAGSALIARDIAERKRVERALQKRLRQLDVLSQAGQALILGDRSAPPLQNELFDRVRLAISTELFMSYEVDEEADVLPLVADVGLHPEQRQAWREPAIGTALCGLPVRRRTPVIVESLQASELAEAQPLREAGVRSFGAFPIIVRGLVRGVAVFASTTRERFREGDLQVIQTVCDQVAAIMERESLLAELHHSEQSLRLSDRRKDDFIATLAHELRNPLAPIRNAVGILRRTELPDARLAWCRDVIDRQVTQMTHLLEDLLDVSRVTRNKVALRRSRIAITQAIDQAVESTRPLIESLGHELQVDVPPEPLHVYGDLTRLTQVFANLLNNAAKYTPQGGRIALLASRDADRVRIVVRDSGVGLASEQLGRVFDMFAQFTPALDRAPAGGLGIGLALARGLVELHQGRILAFSAGPGRGSEFVVELPLLTEATDETERAQPSSETCVPTRHRILVIDDNADAAQTLSAILALQGQDVRVAYGGQEGLAVASEWQPEVAVIDIGMPDINGYEVCRRIRSQSWGQHTLLVACTGWGQFQDRQRAAAAGFDVHLVKPIEPEAVARLLTGGGDDSRRSRARAQHVES